MEIQFAIIAFKILYSMYFPGWIKYFINQSRRIYSIMQDATFPKMQAVEF